MDNRQIKYGQAAFIDILGFSEKVAKVDTEDDLTEIENTIGYTYGPIGPSAAISEEKAPFRLPHGRGD